MELSCHIIMGIGLKVLVETGPRGDALPEMGILGKEGT